MPSLAFIWYDKPNFKKNVLIYEVVESISNCCVTEAFSLWKKQTTAIAQLVGNSRSVVKYLHNSLGAHSQVAALA